MESKSGGEKPENKCGCFFYGGIRFKVKKFEHLELKRALRKGDINSIPEAIPSELVCHIFGKVVLSRAGFASHLKSHENRQYNADCVNVFPNRPAWYLYQFCDQICRSDAWVRRHMRVHEEKVIVKTPQKSFVGHICKKGFQKQGWFAKSSVGP